MNRVHPKVAAFEHGDIVRCGSAAAKNFDAREQFLHRERLSEVVVRTCLETVHTVPDIAARRKQKHACVIVGVAKFLEQRKSVELGQIYVEDDEVVSS